MKCSKGGSCTGLVMFVWAMVRSREPIMCIYLE